MPLPLLDLHKVLKIHRNALAYTVAVHQIASERAETEKTNLVARAALSALMHDIACLHRAVEALCGTGWASVAPVLLRTMLEGTMSVALIVNSTRPDVTAFKYFYAKAPREEIDAEMKAAIEREIEVNVGTHLRQMTEDDQNTAKAFLGAPSAGYYWYSDMFPGPTAVIREYLNEDMLTLYRDLSKAAHLGFQGLRFFRDNPDKLDINPRKDPRSQGFAMIASSRILIEATRAREHFEGSASRVYADILSQIARCDEDH